MKQLAQKKYADFDYSLLEKDYFFVFGKETTGLPQSIIDTHLDRCFRIPQTNVIRSLNLSNTAAIIIYEALRQQGFPNLT